MPSELDLFQTFVDKLSEAYRKVPGDDAVSDALWIVKEAADSAISEYEAQERPKEIMRKTPIWEKK